MIIQGSPEILQGPRGLNNQFGAFDSTADTVVQLYQQILQRTPSASEIAYWSAGWGPTVEASEIKDFQQAAAPEAAAANAWRAEQAAIASAAQQAAAAAAQQAAAIAQAAAQEAANKQAVAAAYAAAQAAAAAEAQTKTAAAAALRERALAAVKALYLQVLGREGDTEGLNYFADKFGEVVDPDELQIFKNMAQPEIDARNKYLADMAAKSAKDAAEAKAIALKFAQTAKAAAAKQAAEVKAEAAKKKAVADAYAAAQAAAAAEAQTKTAAAAAQRERALAAVKALYLQVLGREGDIAGLDYFADRFGDVIDPDELQIFKGMAQPEIDARNKYLADMAAKSAKDAADAKAIADQFAKASADEAARQAAAAAAEAANKKAIADAYAAAQAAAKAEELTRTAAAAAQRERALAAVKALYLQVLGREGDQAGIDYFADKFGEVVDPDELQIFSDMAQPEIDARNKYLAEMAKKSAEDEKKAKAIADEFAATAAKAIEDAKKAAGDNCPPGYAFDGETCRPTGLAPPPTTGGINPALILAAAAAAFFIGG